MYFVFILIWAASESQQYLSHSFYTLFFYYLLNWDGTEKSIFYSDRWPCNEKVFSLLGTKTSDRWAELHRAHFVTWYSKLLRYRSCKLFSKVLLIRIKRRSIISLADRDLSKNGGTLVHPAKDGKVMVSVTDIDAIRMVNYPQKWHRLNDHTMHHFWGSYCIKLKRREKPSNGELFYKDKAPVHKSVIAMTVINDCGFNLIENAFYSPNLAPPDFHLFPKRK